MVPPHLPKPFPFIFICYYFIDPYFLQQQVRIAPHINARPPLRHGNEKGRPSSAHRGYRPFCLLVKHIYPFCIKASAGKMQFFTLFSQTTRCARLHQSQKRFSLPERPARPLSATLFLSRSLRQTHLRRLNGDSERHNSGSFVPRP